MRGYQTGTCENGDSLHSAGSKRLELEAGRAPKDSVVRDKWNPQPDRGGGDPAVGGVLLLAERVAGGYAVSAKLRVDRHKLRSAVNDLDSLDRRFHPEHPRLAPAAAYCAIP